MEIFKQLFKNGMNKVDTNGLKTKVILIHIQRLRRPMEGSDGCPTFKDPKQICFIHPISGKLLKLEGKNDSKKLISIWLSRCS